MFVSLTSAASSLMANDRTAWIGHAILAVAFLSAFASTLLMDGCRD